MRLTQDEVRRRYARLVIECGWGGSESIGGRPVNIQFGAPAYELALAIARAAYEAGASRADLTLWSPALDALHVKHATDEELTRVPATWADRWNDLVDVQGATLRIEGTDRPLALAECDSTRVAALDSARLKARRKFYDEGLQKDATPWSIIPYASEDWAKLVFPHLTPGMARRRLEEALVKILGLEHDDFVERWRQRGEMIARRSQLLDELHIKELRFRGPLTTLSVPLHESARFGGGMNPSIRGINFFANLPTFENFTTPDYRGVSGRVAMTKPVLINGQLVEGLKVEFKDGVVQSFSARNGRAAFEAMLAADEGARRLGEVALVGLDDSPIASTGVIFHSILLDENAACHIAFGRAYSARIEGGTKMTDEQLAAIGVNKSNVHRDCMISDEDTTVHALCGDGSLVRVIEDGAWTGRFAA